MNILLTSISRKVGLIRAFQAALLQEGGGKVVAVDVSPLAAALYLADEHYLVPSDNEPEFLNEMLLLCKELNIELLVPTRDEELLFFAEHKHEFAGIGTFIMIASPNTVKTCRNKKMFIEFCRKNEFCIPKTYDSDLPSDIEFPLFVKPCYGKGGQHTTRANSHEELELALKQVPGAIVQEFVDAPEYTIDLFSDFSHRVISVVPRERIRIFGGESFVGRTFKNSMLIRESTCLAEKLKLVGHNTIQCFFDRTVKFTEVNPRFGGGASLGFAAGANTPLYLIKLLKGESIEPKGFKDNYVMLRYAEDFFLDSSKLASRTFSKGKADDS